jgi:hypothetical protein
MDRLARVVPGLAGLPGATVRCLGCRNRVGVDVAVILDDGSLCCSSFCSASRDVRRGRGRHAAVEFVG